VRDIVIKDVGPFIVVLFIFLTSFEVAGIFFFLAADDSRRWVKDGLGDYFFAWLDVGNMQDLQSTLGHERWLNSAFEQRFEFTRVAHGVYTTLFFVLTGIILTNLLIASKYKRDPLLLTISESVLTDCLRLQ